MVSHNKKIKFAVVGCGHIGRRHVEMIQNHPESELVALIDVKSRDILNIENYDVPFHSEIDDLLNSKTEVDVITIASPNGFHTKHCLEALEAKKHIVVEKPMTLTRSDAEKVIYKALNVHRHVFVVMQNRYSPPCIWIKDLIKAKVIGKIFMVQLNCYWNRDEKYYKSDDWHGRKDLDGGTLFTQFSHFIDILYWLFGDIENITSRITNHNHQHLTEFEDSGIVVFNFLNGGMGCINFSTSVWDKNLESSMTVIAEKGSIKISGQYMDTVEYCHVKNYVMPELKLTNPGNNYGAYKGLIQNHQYVINNVVDVLKGRATITTNALEGLKVVDIIERIYNKS